MDEFGGTNSSDAGTSFSSGWVALLIIAIIIILIGLVGYVQNRAAMVPAWVWGLLALGIFIAILALVAYFYTRPDPIAPVQHQSHIEHVEHTHHSDGSITTTVHHTDHAGNTVAVHHLPA